MRFELAAGTVLCVVLAGCGGGAPDGVPEAAQDDAPAAEPAVLGQPVAVEGGEYRDIAVTELQAMLAGEDVPLINVHIPFAGNIPDTDESIPFNEISENLELLPEDRDAPIVLYCRTGPMSEQAATDLVGLGYTNVYNLVGGFAAWSAAGLPLEGQ